MDLTKKTIFPHKDGTSPLEAVKGPSSTYFTGIDDLINHKFTKLITGYAYIYWVRLPAFFEMDDDLKYFKALTQKNFRSFTGLTDITLNTSSETSGFAGNEYNTVTGISRGNVSFTIEHNEYSGSPMTKMYQKWVELIRDSRTGIAVYPKKYNMEYSDYNHTAELLYIMVRPDANNTNSDILEKAVYWSNVVPTNVPQGQYNYNGPGQQDAPEIQIEFDGVPEMNPYVDEFARKVLKEHILNYTSDEDGIWAPITNYGAEEDVHKNLSQGRLYDIMNSGEEQQ